ncbi:MAG: FliB family protein [Polyangiaceae bacterium]|jgi:lysine-N-methylase|nr:FliB family protein [Polyangiaceae bacterium]
MRDVATTAVLAAKYMTRFRCLAGDCEATCCGGGIIPVQESNHRRLTILGQGDAAALALIEHGIQRTPEGPDFARIRFDDGECSMRDGAGLCTIHQRFGHGALFEVCATYPRYASKVDDDLELFGTLACPEVARLALLADDAFELADFTLEEAPRIFRNQFRTESPYYRPFKPVRAALVRLMSEPEYALPDKLFVLLWIADKLKGVLRQGGGAVSPTELDRALGAISQPEVLDHLIRSFKDLVLDGNLAFSVIVASLRPPPEPRHGAQTAGFDAIWQAAVAAMGPALAPDATPTDVELGQAWSRYLRLRAELPRGSEARADLLLTRYVVNHLLTTPYMLSNSSFEFGYDLVVRAACLRLLLTTELSRGADDDAERDAQMVRVIYSFVRAVEHSDSLTVLRRALDAQGLAGLPHAVGFLAVWRPAS